MELTFFNEIGTVKLCGGSGGGFNICNIEGLEPPQKVRNLQSYIGEDGCVENSSQYNQRVITVSGDVLCGDGDALTLKQAARIFSHKGILYVNSNSQKRKIAVDEANITIGKRYGSYCTFVMQFTCDYPHFSDIEKTETAIFKKINCLTSQTRLPTVFTKRITSGKIENIGDIKIYPIITVKKLTDTSTNSTIKVNNLTTGKSILFNKSLNKGEIVEINVKNRTVTSNYSGDVLSTLDRYYTLSDMWCERGINEISVTVDGISQEGIEVLATYENEYTEAI